MPHDWGKLHGGWELGGRPGAMAVMMAGLRWLLVAMEAFEAREEHRLGGALAGERQCR